MDVGSLDQGAELNRERAEPKSSMSKKISRNDPCSCGSGRKYKKCCGENGRIQMSNSIALLPGPRCYLRTANGPGHHMDQTLRMLAERHADVINHGLRELVAGRVTIEDVLTRSPSYAHLVSPFILTDAGDEGISVGLFPEQHRQFDCVNLYNYALRNPTSKIEPQIKRFWELPESVICSHSNLSDLCQQRLWGDGSPAATTLSGASFIRKGSTLNAILGVEVLLDRRLVEAEIGRLSDFMRFLGVTDPGPKPVTAESEMLELLGQQDPRYRNLVLQKTLFLAEYDLNTCKPRVYRIIKLAGNTYLCFDAAQWGNSKHHGEVEAVGFWWDQFLEFKINIGRSNEDLFTSYMQALHMCLHLPEYDGFRKQNQVNKKWGSGQRKDKGSTSEPKPPIIAANGFLYKSNPSSKNEYEPREEEPGEKGGAKKKRKSCEFEFDRSGGWVNHDPVKQPNYLGRKPDGTIGEPNRHWRRGTTVGKGKGRRPEVVLVKQPIADLMEDGEPAKRKPGRPKGSKNKPMGPPDGVSGGGSNAA